VHTLGLAPILVDDDITIAESGAIVRKKSLVRSCLARMLTEYGIQSTCSESTANSGRRSQNQLKSMISTVRSQLSSLLARKGWNANLWTAGPVTHYAEGSLMPILITKLVCTIVPERAPLLLKPFLWGVFEAVSRRMLAPRLKTHMEYVCGSRTPGRHRS
jgi:hypothetical protein